MEQIRILLIDDESHLLDAASQLLSRAGYQVLEAATGAEGLALAQQENPDLILLDAGLSDMPGTEVCRRLKARPALSRSLVILLSDPGAAPEDGGLTTASQATPSDAEADGYLTRPIAGSRLLAWVRTLARLREAEAHTVITLDDRSGGQPVEQALQKSQAQMRSIFQAAPVGIGVVSERVLLEVNDRLCEITGYSRAELVGRSARMVYPSDKEYEYVGTEKYRQIQEEGTGAVETRFQRKDGTIVDVLLSSTPLDPDDLAAGVTFTALDITERKRVEEALRESEAKFRSVVQSSPMGMHMYRLQEEGRLVFIGANPAADRILGVDHDRFIGKTIEQAFPPLAATEVPDRYRRAAALGESWTGEQVDYEDDEIVGAFEVYAFQTEPDRMVAMFLDVTGRKQAEQALRRERDRAQGYLDIAAVMFIVLNAKGEVVLLNRKGCEILGYEQEEILGKSWFEGFLPADVARETRRVFEHLVAGEVELVEYHENAILTKGGEERMIAWHNTTLRNAQGRVIGTLSSGEDITERQAAQQALKRRAAQLQLLNDIGGQIAAVLDLDSLLGRAAGLVRQSFGYHHVALFTLDRQQAWLVMRARAGDFEDLFPLDHRLELGQGLVGWVALHGETTLANDVDAEPRYVNRYPDLLPTRSELAVPIRIGSEVVGVLDVQSPQSSAFDDNDVLVLETLASQIAVAIKNARLFAEAEAALQQLKETHAQLVQSAKLAAIGELAAGVAHEINNPLTSILGFAELGTWQLGPEDPGRQEFDIIVKEARRSRSIVRGLLEFARQTRPMAEPANLNDVLRQSLALVRVHIEKRGVVVEEEYAGDLGEISLDAGQMKQVFLNLITNAAHAMPQGGTLTVGTLRRGDRLLVRVSDTGTGIPPENRERIFEPFFTTKPSGTGLGLSVSLGIVQQHGGQIEVESRMGEGSTFTVWLPAGEKG